MVNMRVQAVVVLVSRNLATGVLDTVLTIAARHADVVSVQSQIQTGSVASDYHLVLVVFLFV